MIGRQKDGALTFNTYRKSAKARNLLRDPRAAVILLDNWSVSPSTAQFLSGVMEETATFEFAPPLFAETDSVPLDIVARVNSRAAEGKRICLRLKELDPCRAKTTP
jgi:hypothetical protein